ncbi:hypothetical protein T4B_2218 [Trichinella pseudospiralis]|uniref:Uncharacterized protein n=1 Tax=Trichinella pseudospiralis TaxID=6337 RepID=A0A0V1GV55_TRIPS|nr:hypothetical protein T4B_2218 [Trichinella pseudospiralis]
MSGQVPGSTIVMPMSCSNGKFQQGSLTTILFITKTPPLSLLLNIVHVSAVLPPHFRHFRPVQCIMVPCTVHIFSFPQNNILRASVQPFCLKVCRFFTTTLQEFQVASAVLADKQCTVRERQSAFHYPTSTTMHGLVRFPSLKFCKIPFRCRAIMYI